MRIAEPKEVFVYQTKNGEEPFTQWLDGLQDAQGYRAILQRISRLELGLYGDCEPVGQRVLELRIFVGPGYRIYFGESEGHIVILLYGGDKKSQAKDVKTAKEFWKEYQSRD